MSTFVLPVALPVLPGKRGFCIPVSASVEPLLYLERSELWQITGTVVARVLAKLLWRDSTEGAPEPGTEGTGPGRPDGGGKWKWRGRLKCRGVGGGVERCGAV